MLRPGQRIAMEIDFNVASRAAAAMTQKPGQSDDESDVDQTQNKGVSDRRRPTAQKRITNERRTPLTTGLMPSGRLERMPSSARKIMTTIRLITPKVPPKSDGRGKKRMWSGDWTSWTIRRMPRKQTLKRQWNDRLADRKVYRDRARIQQLQEFGVDQSGSRPRARSESSLRPICDS